MSAADPAVSAADQAELDALLNDYALAVDTLDAERLLAVFEPAGELDWGGGTWRGHEELLAILAAVADAEQRLHQLGTRRFSVDPGGDTARGVAYCTANAIRRAAGDDGFVLQVFSVRYEDLYARGGDGRFRIRHRRLVTLWTEERPVRLP